MFFHLVKDKNSFSGDHYFWRRRRMMALPMVRERGIGSIILENPFYGLRKPKYQVNGNTSANVI
jgi:hypothetical protein